MHEQDQANQSEGDQKEKHSSRESFFLMNGRKVYVGDKVQGPRGEMTVQGFTVGKIPGAGTQIIIIGQLGVPGQPSSSSTNDGNIVWGV